MAESESQNFIPGHLENKMETLKSILDTLKVTKGNEDSCKNIEEVISENEDMKLQSIKNKLASCKKELNKTKQEMESMKKALNIIGELRTSYFSEICQNTSGIQCKMKIEEILQQSAETLPLFINEAQGTLPSLCGSVPVDNDYIAEIDQMVAAFVTVNEEDTWILARVGQYNPEKAQYRIHDIDNQDLVYSVKQGFVIPLPNMRANPKENPEAIFKKDSLVLALYPKTTCFYKAIVHELPSAHEKPYLVAFEDMSCPSGFSTPTEVPQQYVLLYKTSQSDVNLEV